MPTSNAGARSVFDSAAREYDAARPSYPPALFDELERRTGPLTGRLTLDWGAGTGIASRQLAARGANVISLDIGEQMLRRALARSPQSRCILADGHRMPVRSGTADLVTFAQAWHWFDRRLATAEVAGVLKPGGHWAAWWNRASATGQPWFDRYEDVLSAACPGYTWRHRSDAELEPERADSVAFGQAVEPLGAVVVPWVRHVSSAAWMTDERSKSYIISLEPRVQASVLDQLAAIVAAEFAGGQMTVRYVTRLVLARKAR